MKITKKVLALTLIYSLLLPIWGLSFLSIDTASVYSIFLALIFTFYSARYAVGFGDKKWLHLLLLFAGPLTYIAVGLYAKGLPLLFYYPIFWAFCLVIAAVFLKRRSKIIHPAVLFVAGFCTFYIYPMIGSVTAAQREANRPAPSSEYRLSEFDFLDAGKDTLQLGPGKPVLVETWNESCAPCLASIKDLQDEFADDSTFWQVYLYQKLGKKERATHSQIFDYQFITHKKKILADIENTFYKKMNLSAMPYFLVFDRSGKLVGYQTGYNPSKKEDILKKLRTLLEKAAKS